MNVQELKGKTIAFAASGGLDSCTITRWLTDQGVNVVAITADLAQPDELDLSAIQTRMLASGAVESVIVSGRDNLARKGLQVIQSQAFYEGRYWNTTGIARCTTVEVILDEMKKRNIGILSHGATGRGNDQVRFQLAPNMLAPEVEVYAPWRDENFLSKFRGRSEMIEFCQSHKLPITATKSQPYSTDANMLGLTHEAGILESLTTPASAIAPKMGCHPKDASDAPEVCTITFRAGAPVAVNGKDVDIVGAFLTCNEIGGKHGIGIGTHVVENRFVGIKSRGVYESPGMELLGTAYETILQLVLDRRARELYETLSRTVAKQIYQGYFYDLATQAALSGVAQFSRLVTGTVSLSLYKGGLSFNGVTDAPHSLYSEDDASMEAVGSFDHSDSEGFLRVLGVSARAIPHAKQTGPLR